MELLIKIKKIIFIFFVSGILVAYSPVSIQGDVREQQYAFKAAFIFHFIEYIEWKNNAESPTFNFAVLGKSPITEQMLIISNNQKVKNKKMDVKEYNNLDDVGFCNILFVPQNSSTPIETIVSKFAGKPVLIVTEQLTHEKNNAHINFFISEKKLKFEINRKAVNKVEIKISSQLLQHATIVDDE